MSFAHMEMETVSPTVLRAYDFELASTHEPALIASTNLKPGDLVGIDLPEREATGD